MLESRFINFMYLAFLDFSHFYIYTMACFHSVHMLDDILAEERNLFGIPGIR
jgi:hypothetical protein